MAAISITPSAVQPSAAALDRRRRCILGATLAAGAIIYLDTADSNKAKAADANGTSALIRTPVGMLINGGVAGQPGEYIDYDDDLTIGTHGVTINNPLILSATAGSLEDILGLATGVYSVILGIAKTTTKIVFNCRNLLATGVAS